MLSTVRTSLHNYEVKLFSAPFLEQKSVFGFKLALVCRLGSYFSMRPLALKYVKKCASKMDLKIFENLEKARKSNLLSHEFPAEAIFFQSISCLFKDFYLIDFDAKGIKLKLKNYSFLIPSLIQISLKLLQKWRRKKLHCLFMTL